MFDLISIIVPIYNASEYLNQCIESILSQTYRKLEIILVDDGSTDSSGEICDHYQESDDRILTVHQRNQGLVSARKAGLAIAKGKYIGFVDADDYIEQDMFEKLYLKLIEFDADFIHSGMITNGGKYFGVQEGLVNIEFLDKPKYIANNIFKTQTIFFALWSKLFKAEIIKNAYMSLPDEQSFGEDLLCLCNCICQSKKFYLYNDAFYHYREYEGSLSHLNWLDICIEESKLYSQVLKLLKRNNLLEVCYDSVRYHYKKRIIQALLKNESNEIVVLKYIFPKIEMVRNKRVAIYGAGNVGKYFYYQLLMYGQCEIVAWVDKHKYGTLDLVTIEKPDKLREIEYEVLLLAVKKKSLADEIKSELIQSNICNNDSLILWEEPVYVG